jgi:hypothetical protein
MTFGLPAASILGGSVSIGKGSAPTTALDIGTGTVSGTMGTFGVHMSDSLEVDGFIYGGGTNFGFRTETAANTACNTTCGRGCIFGQDTAALTYAIVDCTSASADICLCTK